MKDYQNLLKASKEEPALELFTIKYETLYNSFQESYAHETHYIKKCREYAQEITVVHAKLDGTRKMIQVNEENQDMCKKELEEKRKNIEQGKIKK